MWRAFKVKEVGEVADKEEKKQVVKRKLDVHLHVKIEKDGGKQVNIVEDTKNNYLRAVDIAEERQKSNLETIVNEETKKGSEEALAEDMKETQIESDKLGEMPEESKPPITESGPQPEENAERKDSNHGSEDILNVEQDKKRI